MPMSKYLKIIVGVVVVVAVFAGIFLFFSGSTPSDTAVIANGAPASDAEVTFSNLSSELDSITFNTTVLSDPRFQALVDIHTAILPETSGRSDPFAPIGSGS